MEEDRKNSTARQKRNLWNRLARLTHYRLIVPIKRSRHPPEYTARGVLVGMAWALTPLVGIQMYTVFMTWLIARKVFKWDFSLIVGLAWTWTTNVITMLPVYYVFYVTGQLILGRWDDLTGYDHFIGLWLETFGEGLAWQATFKAYMVMIVRDWGLAMVVGSLPWSALGGWLGYRWGLAFARRRDQRRRRRREVMQLA